MRLVLGVVEFRPGSHLHNNYQIGLAVYVHCMHELCMGPHLSLRNAAEGRTTRGSKAYPKHSENQNVFASLGIDSID